MPLFENPIALILLGAVISLVTSAVVTALHAGQMRRAELRAGTRASARHLTSAFIAERETNGDKAEFLSEAELTVMSMTERKTRERLTSVVRLLREHDLPEVEQLSGIGAATAKRVLCDHALDVLGAHLRADRLPEIPTVMRKMLSVEEEALSIRSGEKPKVDTPIEKSSVTARPRHTGSGGKTAGTRKPAAKTTKSTKPAAKKTDESTAPTEGKEKESTFWDD